MLKKYISLFTAVALCVVVLSGCNNSTVLDNQVNDLVADYLQNHSVPSGNNANVTDTLDLMLDSYVSGLKKPDPGDIQNTIVEPDDEDNTFDELDEHCNTLDEMKALLLKSMSDTADDVDFYIPASVYSSDVLYDVIFNQLCEEYMIETMGMQTYVVSTMSLDNNLVGVNVDFSYFGDKYSIAEVKDMKRQSLEKAKNVINQLNLANKTEYECVKEINKYLCDNCVYPDKEPYSAESHSIYGALIEKSAVCEGYARSAQLFFSLCGLDSYYVVGDTPEGGHAWNLVKVGDEYYQLDVTWNDTDFQPNAYFLVTDRIMSQSRTWDKGKYPASAGSAYSA